MTPYRQLDAAYERLCRRHSRRPVPGLGDLDLTVATIRDDEHNVAASDRALRDLLTVGRKSPEANTVALHALAPALRYRLSRAATAEYHHDAVGELAMVILEADLAGTRLAHRLVNRTHSRVWRRARAYRTRGEVNPVTIVPREPDQLALLDTEVVPADAVAEAVVTRVSLQRFRDAVDDAVANEVIPEAVWTAYRDHRIRRALVSGLPPTTGQERVVAHRAARRLAPYISAHLDVHAA